MNVMFLSSEVTPFAKVGGLADVVGALPASLLRLGVDVRIIMPKYESLNITSRIEVVAEDVPVTIGSGTEYVQVHRTLLPGSRVVVYLIEHDGYLSKGPVYDVRGESPLKDLQRFLFFSAAALAVMSTLNWEPDILHCHDWHTALVPALSGGVRGLARTKSVLTIHNLAHQGVWSAQEVLGFLGFSERENIQFSQRDHRGDFNLLQQGILAASAVNTVSPTYAQEILTPEYGEHLENDLSKKLPPISGILNGIDTERFDPSRDVNIRIPFDQNSVASKSEDKLALHELCGFTPDSKAPTFAFIGRLADQKGVDLIVNEHKTIINSGGRLVVLGTGVPDLESKLARLAKTYPHQVYCNIRFNAVLAQRIYAGADVLLMPSKFEPCGLGQMIAMRYGTIPVVRETGGLKDTVTDATNNPERGLGFSFKTFDAQSYRDAILRALAAFHNEPVWTELIKRCMAQDFSWHRSARQYLKLYESLREQT